SPSLPRQRCVWVSWHAPPAASPRSSGCVAGFLRPSGPRPTTSRPPWSPSPSSAPGAEPDAEAAASQSSPAEDVADQSPVCRARNSGLILDKGPSLAAASRVARASDSVLESSVVGQGRALEVERVKKEHTVNLSCSFCGKSQREVRKLIAGPTV